MEVPHRRGQALRNLVQRRVLGASQLRGGTHHRDALGTPITGLLHQIHAVSKFLRRIAGLRGHVHQTLRNRGKEPARSGHASDVERFAHIADSDSAAFDSFSFCSSRTDSKFFCP